MWKGHVAKEKRKGMQSENGEVEQEVFSAKTRNRKSASFPRSRLGCLESRGDP